MKSAQEHVKENVLRLWKFQTNVQIAEKREFGDTQCWPYCFKLTACTAVTDENILSRDFPEARNIVNTKTTELM